MADKITTAERLGKKLDAGADIFKDARLKLLDIHTISGPKNTLKISAVVLFWLAQNSIKVFNKAFVNNSLLRIMERGTEKLFSDKDINIAGKIIKNNPWILSYLAYFMMIGSILSAADRNRADSNDGGGKKIAQTENTRRAEPNTETLAKDIFSHSAARKTADVSLDRYWPDIVIGLTELETYYPEPRRNPGEKRYTSGLGLTWTYKYNNSGALRQTPNGEDTPARGMDDNFEQLRRHLIAETFPRLVRVTAGRENITDRAAIALVYAGYQRLADMDRIAEKINNAKNDQQIADAFMDVGNMNSKWLKGTLKRRWICAAYAIGAITSDDLLNMNRDAFSAVDINTIIRHGHFLLGPETVKYVLSRRNSNNTVSDFLNGFETGRGILAAVGVDKAAHDSSVAMATDVNIEKSMVFCNRADRSLAKKNYTRAIDLFKQAIDHDPDNIEAYSSLALAYNKLGDQKSDIKFYEQAIVAVAGCNQRMNDNKELLLDYDIKAASYYNAGRAREKIANIYELQGKKDLAQENMRLALNNYKTALENCRQGNGGAARIDLYSRLIKKLENKLKNKTVAYESGAIKINNIQKQREADIYGLPFNGNIIPGGRL